MAARTLSEQLRQRGDKLLRYPPPPPRDLSPPAAVAEGAQLLGELIAGWEQSVDIATSMSAGSTGGSGGGSGGNAAAAAAAQEFAAVLAAVAGPLQEACLRSSEALNPRAASRCVPQAAVGMVAGGAGPLQEACWHSSGAEALDRSVDGFAAGAAGCCRCPACCWLWHPRR